MIRTKDLPAKVVIEITPKGATTTLCNSKGEVLLTGASRMVSAGTLEGGLDYEHAISELIKSRVRKAEDREDLEMELEELASALGYLEFSGVFPVCSELYHLAEAAGF